MGSLQYLSIWNGPNLSYAVLILSHDLCELGPRHLLLIEIYTI